MTWSIFSGRAVLMMALAGVAAAASPDDQYVAGPDSRPVAGVPHGQTFQFEFSGSRIFPGTVRTVTVYVPAEYRGDKPACVFVGLDNLGFEAATVFDNLIYRHEMPVTIGVGVGSGMVPSARPPENPRWDRSMEFDGLNDRLARFLLEELLPEVQRRAAPDGRKIILSDDPNDRAIGGASTGGIGSFTAAWQRPDAFRRVFTAIGTFVGMRGGDRYPVLVRKTEPKPIRIFMQDGSRDEWPGGPEMGDWWMSNQTMERALEFAGYDVRHVWGEGTHNGNQALAVFPEAMKWLWRDWPKPIVAGHSQNTFLQEILPADNTGWTRVGGDQTVGDGLAADEHGEIVAPTLPAPLRFLGLGPGDRRYVADGKTGDLSLMTSDQLSVVAPHLWPQQIDAAHDGRIYATSAGAAETGGELWLVAPGAAPRLLDRGLRHPSGIALSPDGLWLAVVEKASHGGYSYRVKPDGSVDAKQKFYWLQVADEDEDSGATALAMDRDGRLYAATRVGVQVLDRNGRVRAILPLNGQAVIAIAFGGPHFNQLYVVAADHHLYRRTLTVVGAPPAAPPITLPPWSAG